MEIKPMLLTEVWDKKVLEEGKLYQIKENGVRAIVHINNNRVIGIRNRNNNPILYSFPEFRDIDFPFKTAILDCEICVFKNGKSIFYGGIDKRRSVPSHKILDDYPATMVVFDALRIGEETLVMKPYQYRYDKIAMLKDSDRVKLSKNYDGKELWTKVKENNLEGVVIKNPRAIYELDKRSKEYLKLKNYKLCDVIVDKVEPNDKGIKIFGKITIDGNVIEVECQLGGVFDVEIGSTITIKYLDIFGKRLIQPTKVSREQVDNI